MTLICVSKFTIIGPDNGLSPGRRQAIIWTNAAILLIGPMGTNFSEILIEICTFSFKKMHLNMSSGNRWLFCLGLNVLSGTYILVAIPGLDCMECLPHRKPSHTAPVCSVGMNETMASLSFALSCCTDICTEHGKPYNVYVIAVTKRYSKGKEDTWEVVRQYSDFECLHSKIMELVSTFIGQFAKFITVSFVVLWIISNEYAHVSLSSIMDSPRFSSVW